MAEKANARAHGDDSTWGKGGGADQGATLAKQAQVPSELVYDKSGTVGAEKYALLSEHRMVFGEILKTSPAVEVHIFRSTFDISCVRCIRLLVLH